MKDRKQEKGGKSKAQGYMYGEREWINGRRGLRREICHCELISFFLTEQSSEFTLSPGVGGIIKSHHIKNNGSE